MVVAISMRSMIFVSMYDSKHWYRGCQTEDLKVQQETCSGQLSTRPESHLYTVSLPSNHGECSVLGLFGYLVEKSVCLLHFGYLPKANSWCRVFWCKVIIYLTIWIKIFD